MCKEINEPRLYQVLGHFSAPATLRLGQENPRRGGRDVQEIITERLCQEGQLTLDGRVNAVNTKHFKADSK